MPLDYENPFTRQKLEEERAKDRDRAFSVKLNRQEVAELEEDAYFLHLDRPSTTLKQLAEIGRKVIRDPQTAKLFELVFKNNRLEQVSGRPHKKPDFWKK